MNNSSFDFANLCYRRGVKNIIVLIDLLPIRVHGPISYTTSSDKRVFVPCEIDESEHMVFRRYKVTLRSMDESYGKESFYIGDLENMIRRGQAQVLVRDTSVNGIFDGLTNKMIADSFHLSTTSTN